MTTTSDANKLPHATRVLNTTDGEPGVIINGFSFDPETGWYEYEVETQYGLERWLRSVFVLMSEIEDNA